MRILFVYPRNGQISKCKKCELYNLLNAIKNEKLGTIIKGKDLLGGGY